MDVQTPFVSSSDSPVNPQQTPSSPSESTPAVPTSAPSLDVKSLSEMLENATALLLQVKTALEQYARGKSLTGSTVPLSSSLSPSSVPSYSPLQPAWRPPEPMSMGDRVVEGVFNGSSMVGMDGKIYQVPPNYASKSKLVEGDRLKLIIRDNGMFVYKQISPVDRERLMGTLERSDDGHGFAVRVAERVYAVLLASVTYYHGDTGDEVVLLVPKGGNSHWGAVENIIRHAVSSPMPSIPSTPPAPSVDPLNPDIDSLLSDLPRTPIV